VSPHSGGSVRLENLRRAWHWVKKKSGYEHDAPWKW